MKYQLSIALFVAAALSVHAACPNQCSGHGRCGENDKCSCFQQSNTPWGQRFGWTGADCSLRTCPLGVAFDSISTLDNRLSLVTYGPADGHSGTSYAKSFHVFLDRDFLTEKNVGFTVRVSETDGKYQFQWKRESDDFYSQPVDITATQASSVSNAYELNSGSTATGVRVYFTQNDGSTALTGFTGGSELFELDTYTFIANHNNGIDWIKSDDNTVHQEIECSGRGLCDQKAGRCQCFTGYTGEACQRTTCPNSCSGHGVCQEIRRFASDAASDITDLGNKNYKYDKAYDARKQMGCLCDNGFRGSDCSLIECPSGPDPLRGDGGAEGRDCSGRGLCDYSTGLCKCFKGYFGERCEQQHNFA